VKLKTRLTILFLTISLVPLISTSYFAYTQNRQRVEEMTLARLDSINSLKAGEFQRWLDNEAQSLRELARRPLIRLYSSIIFTPTADSKIYGTEFAKSAIYDDHFLPTLYEEGGFTELFLLHPESGAIMVSTQVDNVGKFREREAYFVNGKEETFVQNAYYALDRGHPLMTISTPVLDENGRLLAVLAGHVDLNEMTNIMHKGHDSDKTLESYLVNKFNFFITESRFLEDTTLTKVAYSSGIDNCLSKKDGFGFYEDYRGKLIIGVYQWLPEHELCILTEINQSEAFAPVIDMRNMFLLISLLVAAVIILVGIIFTSTITNPIHKLVYGTEQITAGNLDYRIEIKSVDEIGQLAKAFNLMASTRQKAENSLRDYQGNLENLVAERTQRLQKSEQRLLRVIEASNTGIWDWHIPSNTVYYSPRWKSLLGYEDHEIENTFEQWEARLHPDDKQRMLDAVATFLNNPVGHFNQSFRMLHKDGSYRWILNRSAVMLHEDGRPIKMYGSHLDITEWRAAEEALAQKAADLAQSNEELQMFAYIASHDLQEPLRMVTSYLQLLNRKYAEQFDDEANEYIFFAVDGAKRMHQLINDLLAYSRIGTRGKELTEVDAQEVLNNVLRLMQFSISDNPATVTFDALPIVQADGSQLSQLFQNLISNAIKFQNDTPPVIHISVEKQEGVWLFSVKDNGIGIDPQSSTRIFDVFQRLHNRDTYPGTGIGLAICKKIVERHGGKIWVQSQPTMGATFYFTLPFADDNTNLQ
jgi:PAS domain S-box-containing protein